MAFIKTKKKLMDKTQNVLNITSDLTSKLHHNITCIAHAELDN
jgi:hypothetical protein